MISLLLGGYGEIMKRNTINFNYDTVIARAKKESDIAEAVKSYLQAVDIKPTELDTYQGLVDAYKDDATFTVEEEGQFKKKINLYLDKLRSVDGYEKIAFDIGKLYWYYYDYGKTDKNDNQITRMKSAILWFEDVLSYGKEKFGNYIMAKIYYQIGKFNKDIILNIEEASDKGMYKPYWENIKELIGIIEDNPDESEIVKLELYKLAIYSIETYGRKFKSEGVEEDDIYSVYKSVKDRIESIKLATEKTRKMKVDLVRRFHSTLDAIKNTYR
jgi:eukaryotic-like serine/threonine-protein kinase